MVPHDADEKMGLNIEKPELWNGFVRPAFLQPTDPRYSEIASLYYSEQQKLFGKADYYSMDPFHELENADEVDFDAAGKAVMAEMKKVNPKAVWVVQGWTENPRPEMIKNLKMVICSSLTSSANAALCGVFLPSGNVIKVTNSMIGCSVCLKILVAM